MIPDKETNTVYFSDLIRTSKEFKPTFGRIETILDKCQVRCEFLTNTKDIWCRDYMPIQIDQNNFVQFRYEPFYLRGDLHLQSDPKTVLKSNRMKAKFSDIILDGGNVVKWNDKVILTTRVFKENPQFSQTNLTEQLEKVMNADVYFIPDITEDMTGHADGHLRFIDSKTVLVNELKDEFKYWQKGFLKMIKQAGLDFVEIPWFEYKDKHYKGTAVGGYVNYLEVGDFILFPVFEVAGNKDEEALKIIESVFPNRKIKTININEIGKHGGLLNCITWTVKE